MCHISTSQSSYFPAGFLGDVLLFEEDVFLEVDTPLEEEFPFTGFFPFAEDFGAGFEDVVFLGVGFVAALAAGFFAAVDEVFLGVGFLALRVVAICSSSFSVDARGTMFSV
jgi:hypothetical protein